MAAPRPLADWTGPSEDPREHGLTAQDLRLAAALLYHPGDKRYTPPDHCHATAVRLSEIRSRLRGLADAIEPDPASR